MTRRETLLALAERVEQATGADRGLDALITIALNPDRQTIVGTEPGRFPQKAIYGPITEFIAMAEANGRDAADYLSAPAYTASLDAAMTLVPEGWHVTRLELDWLTMRWRCVLAKLPTLAQRAVYAAGSQIMLHDAGADADKPANAVTAAALRAHAHAEPS